MSAVRYRWSDAWLLQAIVVGGERKGASLTQIISVGGQLNHALFTDAELEGGFARQAEKEYFRQIKKHRTPA